MGNPQIQIGKPLIVDGAHRIGLLGRHEGNKKSPAWAGPFIIEMLYLLCCFLCNGSLCHLCCGSLCL